MIRFPLFNERMMNDALAYTKRAYESEGVSEVVIQPFVTPFTERQRLFYWAIVSMIAKHNGDSKRDLHTLFKWHYLTPSTEVRAEDIYEIPGSTTILSRDEYTYLIESILAFASSSLGLIVPPNNLNEIERYER